MYLIGRSKTRGDGEVDAGKAPLDKCFPTWLSPSAKHLTFLILTNETDPNPDLKTQRTNTMELLTWMLTRVRQQRCAYSRASTCLRRDPEHIMG